MKSFSLLQNTSLNILVLAVCFPLMLYSSYLLIVALLLGVFTITLQKRWRFCRVSPTQILFLIVVVFEICYSLNDLDERLSVYLPLLIFPIILSSYNISKENIFSIRKMYVCFLFILILLGLLLMFRKQEYGIKDENYFIILGEEIDFNRIYLSMYCLMGAGLSYFILLEKPFSIKKDLYIYGFFAGFFALMVFFLNARSGVIYLIGWIFYLLVIKIKEFRKYKLFYFIAIIILIAGAKYSYSNPGMRGRFQSMTTDPRVDIINSSLKVIKEKPLIGHGYQEGLQKLFKELHEKGIPNNYNCHNQFLQYELYYGILGLLVFLYVLSHFIYLSIKTKNGSSLFFIGMIILFCGIESILERQRGVVLFAFFYNLYFFHHKKLIAQEK